MAVAESLDQLTLVVPDDCTETEEALVEQIIVADAAAAAAAAQLHASLQVVLCLVQVIDSDEPVIVRDHMFTRAQAALADAKQLLDEHAVEWRRR